MSSVLIALFTIWIAFLPILQYIIVPAEKGITEEVLQTFIQPNYFAITKISLGGEWKYVYDTFERGNYELYYEESYDDGSWNKVVVPFEFKSTRHNSTLWLRRTFTPPTELKGERYIIVFKGVWAKADVWLNGRYLGSHTGYFSPFFFDVTNVLVHGSYNLLTVFVDSLVDKESIGLLTGLYGTSGPIGQSIGPIGTDPAMPIGLWNDVELATTGSTVVQLALVAGTLGGSASANFRLFVKNTGTAKASTDISLSVSLDGSKESPLMSWIKADLDPGEAKWVEANLAAGNPLPWSTWDLGSPNLYQFKVELLVGSKSQGSISGAFGFRDFVAAFGNTGSRFSINGRRIFLRGTTYVSDPYKFTSSTPNLAADYELLRKMNVNFLRPIAHVEPLAFYEYADAHGFMVQGDLPLIGYAKSLDTDKEALREAQRQLIRLVLMLYNSPSVVLWCIHTLPPWTDESAGDLFRLGANRIADASLSELLGEFDDDRHIIEGSGSENEFLNFGWGSRTWENYRSYLSAFPVVLGSQSLPSAQSIFWSMFQGNQISSGLIRSLEGYGYSANLWYSYLGNPEEYKSLSDYVNESQGYQATILKTAIERARLLKGNYTEGITVGLFRDYLPSVSGSLLDYYGTQKSSSLIVSEAFRPTHAIIEWAGDFITKRTELSCDLETLVRLNVWIVNDDPNAAKNARLSWRLLDLTTSSIMDSGIFNVTIPSSDSVPFLAGHFPLRMPAFLDSSHRLRFETYIESNNGSILDVNHFDFSVRAAAALQVSLTGAEMPSRSLFLLVLGDSYRFLEVRNGSAYTCMPSTSRLELWGPVIESDRVYVPVIASLGNANPGDRKSANLTLIPGSIVKIANFVTEISQDRIPDIELSFKAIGVLFEKVYALPKGTSLVTNYTSTNAVYLRLLNIDPSSIVIPSDIPLAITLKARIGNEIIYGSLGNASMPLIAEESETVNSTSLASMLVARNQMLVDRMVEQAKKAVEKQSLQGFYLGLESQRLEEIDRALILFNSTVNPAVGAEAQKRAYLVSMNILGAMNTIYKGATTSQVAIFALVILVCVALAGSLFEKISDEVVFLVISFAVVMTIVYQTYPGFAQFSFGEAIIGSYFLFVALILFFLLPRLMSNYRSEGGVSLVPAIMLAISYSSGNMKKRKTRTLLSLISLTTFVLGLSTFSAMRTTIGASQFVMNSRWPLESPSLILVSKPTGFFTRIDLDFVSSQSGLIGAYAKAESPPSQSGIGEIGSVTIMAVRGIAKGDPNIDVIKASTNPRNATDRLFLEGNSVLISDYVARSQGLEVGMSLVFKNVKLLIVGVFDGSRLRSLKDPDGAEWLPIQIVAGPAALNTTVDPEFLLLASDTTSMKLGARVSKLYCEVRSEDILSAGERLSLLANFYALALPSGGNPVFFFRGSVNELTGVSAIIPLVIIVLNILVVLLSSVQERRSEIFAFSAVGLNPTHIFLLHVAEGAMLGIIGGGIGYLLSFAAFRLFSLGGVSIPVDVKTSTGDMLSIVGISVLVSVLGAAIPAFTASRIATPSLRIKWKLEEHAKIGNEWILQIPARVPQEKVNILVDYLAERLPASGKQLEILIGEVSKKSTVDEYGRPLHSVRFKYSRSGNKGFTSNNTIEVKSGEGTGFQVSLRVNPDSAYPKMAETQVHEVASHIRRLVFEWTASKARVAAPFGSSIEPLLSLVRVYHPQLLIVYSRGETTQKMNELKRKLWREGIWPPAIEVRKISVENPQGTVSRLVEELRDVDTVTIDSDDGAISSAMTLASIILKKNVAIISDGKYTEVQAEKLLLTYEQPAEGVETR